MMVRHGRFAASAAVVLGAALTTPGLGQLQPGMTLQPLGDASAADFYRRVPGCRATVVDASDRRPIAAVAKAQWVMFVTSRGLLEAPVVFQDRGDKVAELRFSVTDDKLGGSLRGTLSQAGAGMRCSISDGCMELPARLTLTFIAGQSLAQTVYDGSVTVVDQCATSASQRVFMTVAWWERVLRLISGH
jgi:hypothetical protein